jgi:hypothetical protein
MLMSISLKDLVIQVRTGMENPIRFFSTSFASSQQEMAEIHFRLACLIDLAALGEREVLSLMLAQIQT